MDDDWPATGTLLAFRYRLVDCLDTGGMAEVWQAEDELLGRPVALKLPTSSPPRNAEVLHQAWKEARTTARLSHPHIAAVHDYREAPRPDGTVTPFVVMELLDGESLAARLERSPLTWQEAAAVGAPVAEALAAAHAHQVVHRDIKPGNVMLTKTGVKILDFGISAVTGDPDDDETGATFGTPAYVSPERLDGKPAEPATDVYALGVILFEMVTGEPPYPVDTWEELTAARAAGPSTLPEDLPAAFRDLVGRCLDDDPAGRPTAAEVGHGLAALAPAIRPDQGELPSAKGYATGRVPAHTLVMDPPARRRPLVRLAIVTLLIAVGGVIVIIGSSNRTQNADPPAAAPLTTAPTTAVPTSPTPVTPSSEPSSVATPPPPSVDDAVREIRAAVEAGQASGEIRPDVAADLINLIRPLGRADPEDVDNLVEDLRRKIRDRVDEGSLAEDRAAILRARLADLGGATGT